MSRSRLAGPLNSSGIAATPASVGNPNGGFPRSRTESGSGPCIRTRAVAAVGDRVRGSAAPDRALLLAPAAVAARPAPRELPGCTSSSSGSWAASRSSSATPPARRRIGATTPASCSSRSRSWRPAGSWGCTRSGRPGSSSRASTPASRSRSPEARSARPEGLGPHFSGICPGVGSRSLRAQRLMRLARHSRPDVVQGARQRARLSTVEISVQVARLHRGDARAGCMPAEGAIRLELLVGEQLIHRRMMRKSGVGFLERLQVERDTVRHDAGCVDERPDRSFRPGSAEVSDRADRAGTFRQAGLVVL